MRSSNVTQGVDRAPNRSLFAALGLTPEELSRFVDQVLRDHVRGAGLRLSQAGPGTAPLLEPDHCAGPVSK